ncbi:MAG: hypothetical protein AAB573_05400 [Patescibacteria group bacterium]
MAVESRSQVEYTPRLVHQSEKQKKAARKEFAYRYPFFAQVGEVGDWLAIILLGFMAADGLVFMGLATPTILAALGVVKSLGFLAALYGARGPSLWSKRGGELKKRNRELRELRAQDDAAAYRKKKEKQYNAMSVAQKIKYHRREAHTSILSALGFTGVMTAYLALIGAILGGPVTGALIGYGFGVFGGTKVIENAEKREKNIVESLGATA